MYPLRYFINKSDPF